MPRTRPLLAAVIAAVLATAAALSPVAAAKAQFDPSLAAGYMTVDLRGTRDTAAGVGIDADGKSCSARLPGARPRA